MKKPEPMFSTDDLVAELAETLRTAEDGMSTREVCLAMGLPPTKASMSKLAGRIADLVALGIAERCGGRKVTVGIDNVGRPVSAWRLVKGSNDSS